MKNIYHEFKKNVNRFPEKDAIIAPSERISYQELDILVNKIAESLRCTSDNDILCILFENSINYLAHYLAAAKKMIKVVPLDVRYSDQELIKLISDIKPTFFAYNTLLSTRVKSLLSEIPEWGGIRDIDSAGIGDVGWLQVANSMNEDLIPEDFTIIFSSGSTGKSKGIIFSQDIIVNQVINTIDIYSINAKDRILCLVVLTNGFGLFDFALTSLFSGATLYLEEITYLNPRKILKKLSSERITFFGSLPFLCELFVSVNFKSEIDLSSLRYYICGGSPLKSHVIKQFKEKYKIFINQMYGLTEVGYITFNKTDENLETIGKLVQGVEFRIIDDNHNDCPVNTPGELIVRDNSSIGRMMVRGYYKNHEETQNMFKNGWLYTKDIVSIDNEGYFYFISRKSEFMIIGGNKTSPIEIENIIAKHPKVQEVVVVSIEDDSQDYSIGAAIVPTNPVIEEDFIKEIIQLCREHLPLFKVPTKIKVFDSLPRTMNNKIARNDVQKMFKKIISMGIGPEMEFGSFKKRKT